MLRYAFKVMLLYCLLITHSIAIPLCFYFEQAFAFKTAFDYSCIKLSELLHERKSYITGGIVCYRGRFVSGPIWPESTLLFFASRLQNVATILAGIAQASQVWPLRILEREQWKLPLSFVSFVLITSLNMKKKKKKHRRNSMWLWNKSSVSAERHLADGEVYLSYHSWEVFQTSSRPFALTLIELVRSKIVSMESSFDRPQRSVR